MLFFCKIVIIFLQRYDEKNYACNTLNSVKQSHSLLERGWLIPILYHTILTWRNLIPKNDERHGLCFHIEEPFFDVNLSSLKAIVCSLESLTWTD